MKEFHTQPEILVLSAYNDFPYVRQAFKLGIYDYCLKREIHEEMLKRHLTNMKQLLSQKGRTQTSGAEQVKDRKQLLAQLLLLPLLKSRPSSTLFWLKPATRK